MLVSNGKNSWWRGGHKGKMTRNGSFVDVSFKRQGERVWFAVLLSDLKAFIEGEPAHGEGADVVIEFDEAADHKTVADQYRSHLDYLSGEDG